VKIIFWELCTESEDSYFKTERLIQNYKMCKGFVAALTYMQCKIFVKYTVLEFACLQSQWKKQIDIELKTERYKKLSNENK
jgi:hypothetical protein